MRQQQNDLEIMAEANLGTLQMWKLNNILITKQWINDEKSRDQRIL